MDRGKYSMAAGALGMVALVAVGVAAGVSASAEPRVVSSEVHSKIIDPRSPDDTLPSVVDREVFEHIDFDTSHLLADSAKATYWSAESTDGQVCLLVVPHVKHAYAAGTCASPDELRESGLVLAVENPDPELSFATILLPDGASFQAVKGYRALSSVLVEADFAEFMASGDGMRIQADDGPELVIRGFQPGL
ncbi:hypothetical protein [Microbacterium sp. RU33B]|uniref:hypothetical protein n=1 Tax=Microbacterium sp. RU33B TaxID=1907390 RepID=UPI000966B340|nr:hypothetical protein [Microbacterium sp. RU33B]SIT72078.1 hypothetical protein SAMN05880545_0992 [Microbacterium sp. RU33B]